MTMEALLFEAAAAIEEARYGEAEALLRKVVADWPQSPDAYHLLAVLAERLGKAEDGLALISKALELAPRFAPFFATQARLFEMAGRCDAALAALDAAARITPSLSGLAAYRAHLLLAANRLAEAYDTAQAALATEGETAGLLRTAGTAAIFLGHIKIANDLLTRATELAPASFAGWMNLALARRFADDLVGADDALGQALAQAPDNGNALWQQGQIAFLRGDWEMGWAGHAHRYAVAAPGLGLPEGPEPMWDGCPIPGKTLRLQADQGLGDMLAFIRLIPLLFAWPGAPAGLILDVPPSLQRLAAISLGTDSRLILGSGPGDFRLPLSGLADLLRPSPSNLPPCPFLRADPARISHWRQRLQGLEGPKVGLVWAGNPDFRFDRLRSLPFDQAAKLLKINGIGWVILQKGPGRVGFEPAEWESKALDFAPECHDFAETAALIMALDLVITCDTAVFHVAAGLGAPVWLLQSCATDWRLGPNLSPPWYPAARIFRQQDPGRWDSVVADVLAALPGVGKASVAR